MWSNEIGHKGERGKDIKKKEGRRKEGEPWCEEREKGRREEEKERKKKKERGRKRKKRGGEVAGCKNYIFRWFPGLLRLFSLRFSTPLGLKNLLVKFQPDWRPPDHFTSTGHH